MAFIKRHRKKSVSIDLSLRASGIMVLTGREALALALMVIDHPGGWSQGTLTLHRDGGRNHPAIRKIATRSGSMEGQWWAE